MSPTVPPTSTITTSGSPSLPTRSLSSLISFFFFSSRRRHTRSYGDWSSDVCSSDLTRDAIDGMHNFTFWHDALRNALPWIASRVGLAPEDAAAACTTAGGHLADQIGRASCRERVESSVVAGRLEKEDGEVGERSLKE